MELQQQIHTKIREKLNKIATKSSTKYFNGEKLPADVFCNKYLLRDGDDLPLEMTPDDMHKRIAFELARVEVKKFKKPLKEKEIYDLLKNFKKIIPQGSPMFGIGNIHQFITLSNCYVGHSPTDSYGGIHKTDQELTQISKRRGGFGLDISHIRPARALVRNSSKSATGILPFMERFSNSIREVGQEGRRGALMITIDIRHPESVSPFEGTPEPITVNENNDPIHTTTEFYNPSNLDFCSVKLDRRKVTGANISIRFNDEFFRCVKDGTTFKQQWPVNSPNPSIVKYIDARKAWKKVVQCAWLCAEPGILFWDNIIRESPSDCYKDFGFETVSTNPCSEIPLSVLDSCRLIAMNLLAYVKNAFLPNAYFDYIGFYHDAGIAQRLIDDIIDLEIEKLDAIIAKIERDPEDKLTKEAEKILWETIKETCLKGRRTGTGITALGDTLAALNIGYGTDLSIVETGEIYKCLKFACYNSSIEMAKELGPFPIWNPKLEEGNPFFARMKDEELYHQDPVTGETILVVGRDLIHDMNKYGRRNIALLTSAPTGSVSMMAWAGHELEVHVVDKFWRNFYGTSSGIEPVYNTDFTRRRKVNPNDKHVKIDFKDQNGDCWEEYIVYHPTVKYWMAQTKLKDTSLSPWHGYCAENIDWKQRVRLQAEAQKHLDHAISSTINLPSDVSPEKVAEIYETAWESGCKGMTVYRDGCRTGVLVDKKEKSGKIVATTAPKRPKTMFCDIHHVRVQATDFLVLVSLLDSEPYEVLAAKSDKISKRAKHGNLEKVKRGVYHLVAENGEVIESVTELCDDNEEALTRMVSTALRHGAKIDFVVEQLEKTKGEMNSFAKSIARALKKYILDGSKVNGAQCPDCHNSLVRSEGCSKCVGCGWSKCS
jgi:ribonucleoside-diphosphate reductase alpha chain